MPRTQRWFCNVFTVISRNLTFGGYTIDKYWEGGLHTSEKRKFTLKNINKNRKNYKKFRGGWGCRLSTGGGGIYPPRGGVQISLIVSINTEEIHVQYICLKFMVQTQIHCLCICRNTDYWTVVLDRALYCQGPHIMCKDRCITLERFVSGFILA